MLSKHSILIAAIAAISSASFAQTHVADHLVLSELGFAMPSGTEFTEIYNPTGTTIDLTNYYITDHERYFDLPSIVSGNISNTLQNGSDHLRQFPAGSSIPPGGVVVVVLNGTSFADTLFAGDIANFYDIPGSPQVFETFDSSPTIPDMGTNYNRSSPDYPLDPEGTAPDPVGSSNLSHTDGGESQILFYWDGVSSLVQDVDMMQYLPEGEDWGVSTNQILNKSSVPEIGPGDPPGTGVLESYLYDSGTPDSMTVRYPDGKTGTIVRRSLLEVEEYATAGNGINGHDETMEKNNLTWRVHRGHLVNHGAGFSGLGMSADNQKPVVGSSTRDVQYPAPGTSVKVTAAIYDNGPFTAKLMVDKGSGYVATNMTNDSGNMYSATINTAGLAENTHITYYVSATDGGGLTATEADYQPFTDTFPSFKGYHEIVVQSAPYASDSFIVSEVMYNPAGANNYANSQYLEFYNPGSAPLNLGGMVVGTDSYPTIKVRFPANTVIPANGYLVLAGNKNVFLKNYPGINADQVVNFPVEPGGAFMAHAGTTFFFFSPNDFGYDDAPVDNSKAFKTFEYTNEAPWPPGTPTGAGAGNTDYSIELTELTIAAESDPLKWAVSKWFRGSPLVDNSVDVARRPGDVTVANVVCDVVYPTSSQAINVSAMVSSSTPISGAVLYSKLIDDASYTATPMTTTDNVSFTAAIGPFADKDIVQYYVEATDTSAQKGAYPYTAPQSSRAFYVQDTPVIGGQVIVNEILNNPYGSDNAAWTEFVELHNRSNTPANISFLTFGYDESFTHSATRSLPAGTIIQPHDYLLLSAKAPLFEEHYYGDHPTYFKYINGSINPESVYDLAWTEGNRIPNGDGTLSFALPNTIDPLIAVDVDPVYALAFDGGRANHPSLELTEPNYDPQDMNNWNLSFLKGGSPQNRNSMTTDPSAVADWSIY